MLLVGQLFTTNEKLNFPGRFNNKLKNDYGFVSLLKGTKMKRWMLVLMMAFLLSATGDCFAQCSICTKTAQQLGDKPAKALNTGIIYLMVAPLAIIGFVGFRWWKNNGRE
jgi:hypothetical protein